jgi:hypothetical protein
MGFILDCYESKQKGLATSRVFTSNFIQTCLVTWDTKLADNGNNCSVTGGSDHIMVT